MGNPAEERQVFEAFLNVDPMFAGVTVSRWTQPSEDPPDVECVLLAGVKIGVELTSWLDESQIGQAKKREITENSFRLAIQPEPRNETDHIYLIWMFPKRRLTPQDGPAFREQLLKLMDETDKCLRSEPHSHSLQGFRINEFGGYPLLAKHLDAIDVHPRWPTLPSTMNKGGVHWLTFSMPGGAYSPDWAVDSLCECIRAKVDKYAAKPAGIKEFHLLVHYDKAYMYNTPARGIDFGYPEAVKAAAARISGNVGVFDKIFAFVPISDGQQVFRLFPYDD